MNPDAYLFFYGSIPYSVIKEMVKIYGIIKGTDGRVGVGDILGDCGSPDPGSIPGPGPISELQCLTGSASYPMIFMSKV